MTECKVVNLGRDVDGVNSRVDKLEVGEGGHVNARAATIGLGNLVQLSLRRLIVMQVVVMVISFSP